MNFFTDLWQKATNAVSGTMSTVTQPLSSTVPSVATDSGSQQTLGTAPEAPGTTLAGGRRHKTRRGGKSKKTHRRRHRKQH
jgi:hypothetical protein